MTEEEKQRALKVLDNSDAFSEDRLKRNFTELGLDFDNHDEPGDRYNMRKVGQW